MLTIRLQRIGKKKKPSYRLVVNEKARDPQAKSLEILGYYSPTQDPKLFEVKADRIKYYIGNGAELSNTVHNLLVKEGVIEGGKKKAVSISNKRKEKIAAKQEAEAEKEKAAQEAAKEAEAAASAPAEEPKEDAVTEEAAPAEAEKKEEPAPADEPKEEKSAEPQPEASEEPTPAEEKPADAEETA